MMMRRVMLGWAIALLSVVVGLAGCTPVSAEARLFLPLSLEFVDEYVLPDQSLADLPVGGLSAIAYDRPRDRFHLLSDDSGTGADSRLYTAQIRLNGNEPTAPQIASVELESVTPIRTTAQADPTAEILDLEGVALSPRQTVLIASEGNADAGIAPGITEFELATGQALRSLPIPQRYMPQTVDGQTMGVRQNLAFEALTLLSSGSTISEGYVEPFRVFAATESALAQDVPTDANAPIPIRLLHYLMGEDLPTLLAEHLYYLDSSADLLLVNGLTELLAIDQGGHFLALERTLGLNGFGAKVYQLAIANATDTSGIPKFVGDLSSIQPIRKQLVLDLAELGLTLDNLEGMTLGPRLPDGSQSLVLISDNNFRPEQKTQLLLFRLDGLN
ncbi:esterase-like activity of phytase family protein [Leptolyngbya sp. AN02str]|uniref:esterase-like activity of phytase family protein n=1 Tax=Leptolyngbya sp. AN02str TaxID=3423363 RepID=UPI003D31253D